jgi:cyanobactin maturation PatA/PatG family protease
MAVDRGAHVINISGGQLTSSSEPDPLLADAIRTCEERNILIVAAAGNDGCECIHLPAAARSVLSVGAADADGIPIASSNWGSVYQTQGVIAPGENLLGATPGGGTSRKSGTSFATAVVSGVAGLLLSQQFWAGQVPDPQEVRSTLLETAAHCSPGADRDHRRCLAGHIDVNKAMKFIRGESKMTSLDLAGLGELAVEGKIEHAHRVPLAPASQTFGDSTIAPSEVALAEASVRGNSPGVAPSCGGDAKCGCQSKGSCGCGGAAQKPALVYALGKIGVDFGTEARRDYFLQAVQPLPTEEGEPHVLPVPLDMPHLLTHLRDYPTDSQAVIWTLNLDATPVYAIQPSGAFAAIAYDRLRESLEAQVSQGVEMVSVPGFLSGSIRLFSGQVVPVIVPSIRGMFDWRINSLVDTLFVGTPDEGQGDRDLVRGRVTDFLNRIYFELRNLGLTGEERALNFTATAAMRAKTVIESATRQALDLDKIAIGRSGVCRPGSECFDIDVSFFNPSNMNIASRVFRFTVDVSDVIPVEIGRARTWTRRA